MSKVRFDAAKDFEGGGIIDLTLVKRDGDPECKLIIDGQTIPIRGAQRYRTSRGKVTSISLVDVKGIVLYRLEYFETPINLNGDREQGRIFTVECDIQTSGIATATNWNQSSEQTVYTHIMSIEDQFAAKPREESRVVFGGNKEEVTIRNEIGATGYGLSVVIEGNA